MLEPTDQQGNGHERYVSTSFALAMAVKNKVAELAPIAHKLWDEREGMVTETEGYIPFDEDKSPLIPISLGEIDHIKVNELSPYTRDIFEITFWPYSEGSPFAFPGDEDNPGVIVYPLIIGAEFPPFIAARVVADFDENRDEVDNIRTYLEAVRNGSATPPLTLDPQQCQAIIDTVLPALTPDIVSDGSFRI